jgi:hypothetical protein
MLKVAERPSKPRSKAIEHSGSDLVWTGADYPMLEPGNYLVCGVKVQGPEWLKRYRRWSIRIEFALAHEPGTVSKFFNMGTDPAGPTPGGKHSDYCKAWTLANGELPRRGEKMSPERFLDGQFFRVQVDTVKRGDDGNEKPEAEFYSRIVKFVSVERV